MKQKLLLALLLILSIKSFSQDSKLSVEMHYPIPIDQNFIGKNYNGIIDFGAKYRFSEITNINIGASINGGILVNNTNDNSGNQDFTIKSYLIQPRFFAELKIESISKLRPFVGFGYSFMIFDASGTNNGFDVSGSNDTEGGINANFGISYDITKKIFIDIQYDYVKLKVDKETPNTTFNTNVNLLKVGLGFRI
ncbi:opacity protein-like surface antigen [Flavobacterium sp. 28A]|uniref:outer membrane beta-barrel protein n=1 Tax=Flavobacterium sp. 28A TaxID=2735895 RepID=UPI00156E527D|nr:OmpW family outer membrane protein [Flavobacterium sp. 28A]NRT15763.1 opacity protein-like surface antigen [Flavobacterium sp. 28A]